MLIKLSLNHRGLRYRCFIKSSMDWSDIFLRWSVLSPNDITKLAVCNVITTVSESKKDEAEEGDETLNQLSHVKKGGLDDLSMGLDRKYDKNGKTQTKSSCGYVQWS